MKPTERKTNAPETRRRREKILYSAAVVVLFGLFAFQLWFHAVRTSATFDEPAHTVAGYRYWQCGDFGINPEHPPLLKLLSTVSLNFRASLIEPKAECGARLTPKLEMFNLGGVFLSDNGVDSVLIPARLLAALMSLVLAALMFLATREMFGRWEAIVALAILAFEPILIAHGSLVTTDMALMATAFGAVYALYRYLKNPTWARFLIVGLAFGLMLAAKHSAVIFVPVLLAVFIADAVFNRKFGERLPKLIFRRVAAFAGFFLIGFVLLWSFYGFRYYALPNATQPTVSVDEYIKANGRPEAIESSFAAVVRAINKLHVFPESYTLGLADIAATNSRNTWIYGHNYATGQWFYFPLAFAVKSSVALLLLLPFGFVFTFFEKEKRREMLFILAPPLAFFAFSLTSKMNIGVRHILPVYAFLIVAAAVGAIWMSRRFYYFRYFLIALLIFHAVTAFRTAPNYIAFANDFFGGTNSTYLIFRESNVDWGQNYKLVNEYLQRENITDCWFAGVGDQETMRVSQPCRLLPDSVLQRLPAQIFDAAPPVVEGTILVSVSNLPPRGGSEYLPLTETEPIAQIGGTIFVYRGRFHLPLAAALSRATRANQFVSLKRFDEAVAEGRAAVELAPGDARTRLALALALLRAGQKAEARREFEAVSETAKANPALFRNQEVRARQELGRLNEQ
jgi:4-amino-4-deoxy-L-arabinose transferase-like glycosyltransferase